LDVDPGVCQGAEHLFGDSGLFGHSEADDGDFGDRIVAGDLGRTDQGECFLDGFLGLAEFVARDGKRHIGSRLHTDVLDDHIDGDLSVGEPFEDLVAHAWSVLDILDRQPGFVPGQGSAADGHRWGFGHRNNHGPWGIREAASDSDGDIEFFGKLDRSVVHDART